MNQSIYQSISQSINPDVLSSGPGPNSLPFLVFCPCIWSLSFSHLHMFSFSLFQPLDVITNISLFQNKMNFLFYLSLFFLMWKCEICYEKEKWRTTYLIQLCTTGIMPYKCVIHTAWRGTNHSLIPHNHVSYAVCSPVRQSASSISYATASHTKWMVTRSVWWDIRIIVTLWTLFSSFIHSFNKINWVWFVGDIFLPLP